MKELTDVPETPHKASLCIARLYTGSLADVGGGSSVSSSAPGATDDGGGGGIGTSLAHQPRHTPPFVTPSPSPPIPL